MKPKELKQISLLTEVASLYYDKNMTQEEIAERLFLSRTRISRLLKKAHESGVVEIKINRIYERNYSLEERVRQHFGIKDVRLYNNYERSADETANGIGILAAKYLSERITKPLNLGVSWGNAMAKTVAAMDSDMHIPLNIVQIMGAAAMSTSINSSELVSQIANKWGGTAHYLNAPLFVPDPYVKQQILKDPVISLVLDMALNSDIILTGVGTLDKVTATNPWLGYMTPELFEEISEQKAIGCIGARFFDREGRALDNTWNQQCIGIDLHDLRRIEEVVAVVTGQNKAMAVAGALKGGYIDVLITDSDTMEQAMYSH